MRRVLNALAALGAFSFAYDVLHPPLGEVDTVLLVLVLVTTGVGLAIKAFDGSAV